MNSKFKAALAAVVLTFPWMHMQASATPLDPAVVSGTYDILYCPGNISCGGNAVITSQNITAPGTVGLTAPGSTVAGVTVTTSLQSSPTITISTIGAGYSAGEATVDLKYYIQIDGPSTQTGFVDVTTQSIASLTGTGPSFGGNANLNLTQGALSYTPLDLLTSGSASVDSAFSFLIGIPILVDMHAYTYAGQNCLCESTSSLTFDPFFTTLNGYSISLSDGVGNSPIVTPLPAALPLFATGLGALGLLGWRRKRKASALAAA
jgi:hypothetical protein